MSGTAEGGARGRSRTDTLLTAADFESAASTNSATRASREQNSGAEYRGADAGLKASLATLLLRLARASQDPRQRIVALMAGVLVQRLIDRIERHLAAPRLREDL